MKHAIKLVSVAFLIIFAVQLYRSASTAQQFNRSELAQVIAASE